MDIGGRAMQEQLPREVTDFHKAGTRRKAKGWQAVERRPVVWQLVKTDYTSLLGDHSECEPPDPIPNSEVKPFSADDSVAVCHAKVGNCQALKLKTQV